MVLSRRAREWIIVAVLLALPLLVLRANMKAPSELNLLDRVLLRISAPIEAALTWVARGVHRGFTRYVYLVDVNGENERLRAENERLRAELGGARQEAGRAASYQELLGLKRKLPVESVAARVVGAETSAYFRIVRIKLEHDGADIKQGMPVVAAGGVVGRVARVFGPYSDVQLASDPKSSIDVVVARTAGTGVVQGIPGDTRYRMRVEYLRRSDDVSENDLVFTSGKGAFPRDLPVGKIVKVKRHDAGLFQEAEVEPAVDFSKLADVLVLKVTADDVRVEPGQGRP